MKTFIASTAFVLAAIPAFAEPACTPAETAKPVWETIQSFEQEGGKIIAFKINDGGCYEIYGTLGDKNFEVFFEPSTGTEIERIEA